MLEKITDLIKGIRELIKNTKNIDIDELAKNAREKVVSIQESPAEHMTDLIEKIFLAYRMFQEWYKGNYPLPKRSVLALAFLLAYFINPADLLPDSIPGIGYLDDALVLGLVLIFIEKDLREFEERGTLKEITRG